MRRLFVFALLSTLFLFAALFWWRSQSAAVRHAHGTHRLTTMDEGEYEPSWSPDGQKIVYVTWTPAGGSIKSVPSGGAPATLTSSTAFCREPVISPDGKDLYALHQ